MQASPACQSSPRASRELSTDHSGCRGFEHSRSRASSCCSLTITQEPRVGVAAADGSYRGPTRLKLRRRRCWPDTPAPRPRTPVLGEGRGSRDRDRGRYVALGNSRHPGSVASRPIRRKKPIRTLLRSCREPRLQLGSCFDLSCKELFNGGGNAEQSVVLAIHRHEHQTNW